MSQKIKTKDWNELSSNERAEVAKDYISIRCDNASYIYDKIVDRTLTKDDYIKIVYYDTKDNIDIKKYYDKTISVCKRL